MYDEKRTIDRLLAIYTRNVRTAATRVLLEHGFLGIDPRHANDGPTALAEINAVYCQRDRFFPVNVEGSERTVFTDPIVNLLFRAWHDIGHAVLQAEFDREGEVQVAQWQAARLAGIDRTILTADVVDQFDYYASHGHWLDDQRAFVIARVFGANNGMHPLRAAPLAAAA
jgi:hypothetical protein